MKLILTYNGLASAAFNVNIVDADPGVFSVDASGAGQGAILNYNATTKDYSVNSSSSAAVRGSIIAIYITGHGRDHLHRYPDQYLYSQRE